MKKTTLKAVTTAILSVLTLTVGLTLRAQNLNPVPQKDIAKIKALIPDELPATVKNRSILVFWRCEGYVHGKAIEYGIESFKQLAAKHPAYTINFSKEYADLSAESLKKYDTLVLMNTTHLKTKDPANKQLEYDLINFVKSGKGLTVIHAGADNFYAAEAAAEMVGGLFWGHPWGAGGTWAFKVEEPEHPINQCFSAATFKWSDEIYQQKSPFYNRAKLRVLVSLDMSDAATNAAKGQRRDDRDNPVSWIRPYGKGRVFYTSFAHDQRAFLDKAILTHIIAGTQYTLGDLKADDSPAGLTEQDIASIGSADEVESHKSFALLQDTLRNTHNTKVHRVNLSKVLALLSDSSATPQGKQVVLRALISCGIQPDADALAPVLRLKECRERAITILTGIDSRAADKILKQELSIAKGADLVTLINAMVIRKESGSIIPLMSSNDPAVAVAAISGVGRIADKRTLKALMKMSTEKFKDTRYTALAACIGTMAVQGDKQTAAQAAKKLMDQGEAPDAVMAACAKAMLLNDPTFYTEGITSSSAQVRATLVRHADQVDNTVLVASLQQAGIPDKVAVITKLAAKDAKECAPAIAGMLVSDKPQVVTAALKALCKLGTEEHVPAMFGQLNAEDATVREAARYALEDMLCAGTSAALIKTAGSDSEMQKSVLKLLAERKKTEDIPALTAFIKSADSNVRTEAWKAMGNICDESTYLQMFAMLPHVSESEASSAASAINASIRNVEPQTRVNAITSAWNSAPAGAKLAFMGVMLRYSDDQYVPMISEAMGDYNLTAAATAIHTLGSWPTLAPYDNLVAAFKTQGNVNLKKTAYRGALKLAMAKGGANIEDLCIDLFKSAPTDADRETLTTLYYKEKSIGLFPVLKNCFSDPHAGASAKQLYVKYYNDKIKSAKNIVAGKELDPKKWTVTASHGEQHAKAAIDRNDQTRWTTGPSRAGMWFSVDLGEKSPISEIIMDTTRSAKDTPNGCEVYVSDDGKNWGSPVARADGSSEKTTTIKMLTSGRYIKIVTTNSRDIFHWSIHELYIKSGMDREVIEDIRKTALSL